MVDTAGRPVPGAVLYVEAHSTAGAFDFAFAEPGEGGEAPPLKIAWRPGALLAVAALAPGKQAFVLYEPEDRLGQSPLVFRLDKPSARGLRFEPRVAKLGFPFEDKPALAARAAAPACAPLRRAFRDAYAPLAAGEPATPAERAKLRALEKLGR